MARDNHLRLNLYFEPEVMKMLEKLHANSGNDSISRTISNYINETAQGKTNALNATTTTKEQR